MPELTDAEAKRAADLQSWKELLASPGWALFVAEVGKAWGPSVVLGRVSAAVSGVPAGNQSGINDIAQQVLACHREINAVIGIPHDRVVALEPQKPSMRPFAAQRRA